MGSISYKERKSRANEIIKRVKQNDLEKRLKEKSPNLTNVKVRLKWVDQMFDTRALVFHLWADFRGYHINVLGEKDIEDLIKNYDELTSMDIDTLTGGLIWEMKRSVTWQYKKLRKENPKERKEDYKDMAKADRRDPWGTSGST
jgi:hypothetical protein